MAINLKAGDLIRIKKGWSNGDCLYNRGDIVMVIKFRGSNLLTVVPYQMSANSKMSREQEWGWTDEHLELILEAPITDEEAESARSIPDHSELERFLGL